MISLPYETRGDLSRALKGDAAELREFNVQPEDVLLVTAYVRDPLSKPDARGNLRYGLRGTGAEFPAQSFAQFPWDAIARSYHQRDGASYAVNTHVFMVNGLVVLSERPIGLLPSVARLHEDGTDATLSILRAPHWPAAYKYRRPKPEDMTGTSVAQEAFRALERSMTVLDVEGYGLLFIGPSSLEAQITNAYRDFLRPYYRAWDEAVVEHARRSPDTTR